jgi:alpha-1,2-mannosyltransferase
MVCVIVWSLYVWNLSAPGWRDRGGSLKGGDFAHLYTLGTVALEHRGADLYNGEAQAALMAARVPDSRGTFYFPIYPPHMSMLMSLFARMAYVHALIAWLILSAVLYAACCYGVWRTCSHLQGEGGLVLLLGAAFPGFFQVILWGQSSVLALACFTLMFLALRGRRDFLAGLALGLLLFKPQLGVACAIVFILARQWLVVAGAAVCGFAQFLVTWAYYGLAPLEAWLRAIVRIFDRLSLLEPKPYQTHSLRIFWPLLFVPHKASLVLYVVSSAVILWLAIAVWRTALPIQARFACVLFASVLISPHMIVYDMVILAPAFLLMADWLVNWAPSRWKGWMSILLYVLYVSPLLGWLTQFIRVQFSVIAMTAMVIMMWRASTTRLRQQSESISGV